ncbi:sensor histidine kinase [Halomonas huangheensis]|uniref:sensor histidine kinase n=1 Tax=Halomonas huangheensis TaxID=1178482 RepID=UPI001F1E8D57|nr:sensor histidine kinase [Halomonas huangheensis]
MKIRPLVLWLNTYPLRLKVSAGAALAFFAAAMVVMGLVVWRQDSLAHNVAEDAAWHAYKLDRDVVQLRSQVLSIDSSTHDALSDVRLSFELLYSRINIIHGSNIIRVINMVPGTRQKLDDIERQLADLDALLSSTERLGTDAISLLDHRLVQLSSTSEQLLIATNENLARVATEDRLRLQQLYMLLMLLILGMSAAGGVMLMMLLREARDNEASRKALETLSDELEVSARRAQSASQAKSDFLATVSHEIRTPLNGVIGMSELMRDLPLPDPAGRYSDTIHHSARQLMSMIDDILDFSKIEAGRMDLDVQPVDLVALIRDAMALFMPRAEASGIRLVAYLDPKLPERVQGDPGRLRQVLLNLLTNAIKFTDEGVVRLSVQVGARQKMLFEVVDTGQGIEKAQISQLFEPFRQGDPTIARQYGGSGLGLAICKRLVEAMSGTIGVESQVGLGSRFWFELPLRTCSEAGDEAAEAALPQAYLKELAEARLLVVEDNPVNQEVAMAMLERIGCKATLAVSGHDALSLCEERRFDLILMDIQMPDIDGREVTRRLRSHDDWRSEVAILAMTAGGATHDQTECQEAGMDGYLTKPLLTGNLTEALRRYLLGECRRVLPVVVEPGYRASNLLSDETLESLRGSLGDERCLMLVDLFREQVEDRLQAIQVAIGREDSDLVRRLAHQLKGESAGVGAEAVAALAALIESRSREHSPAELSELVERLRQVFEETRVAFDLAFTHQPLS